MSFRTGQSRWYVRLTLARFLHNLPDSQHMPSARAYAYRALPGQWMNRIARVWSVDAFAWDDLLFHSKNHGISRGLGRNVSRINNYLQLRGHSTKLLLLISARSVTFRAAWKFGRIFLTCVKPRARFAYQNEIGRAHV